MCRTALVCVPPKDHFGPYSPLVPDSRPDGQTWAARNAPPPVPSHLPRRPLTYDRPRLPSSRLSPPDLLGSPPRHDSNCTRAQCTAGVTDATPVADVGLGTRGRVARAELVPYADALARDFGHGERERGERSWPTTDRRLRAALR